MILLPILGGLVQLSGAILIYKGLHKKLYKCPSCGSVRETILSEDERDEQDKDISTTIETSVLSCGCEVPVYRLEDTNSRILTWIIFMRFVFVIIFVYHALVFFFAYLVVL